MEQIKVSVSDFLKDQVKSRAEELGVTAPEYFRMLAHLDISIQRYQSLVAYINLLYNKINDTQKRLGMYATPIQEVPIIKLECDE